ncbi:MAG: hypothetical protein ACI906_003912 [Candidatus Latescibacterota bacterium]|jgi:hypothetical protein
MVALWLLLFVPAFALAVPIPETAFPGVRFSPSLQDEYTTGTAVLLSGNIEDESKADGQVLLRFTAESGEVIRVFANLTGTDFRRYYIFPHEAAGSYEVEFFSGGAADESLAFVGSFSTLRIVAGSGPTLLPTDYFSGLLLAAPFSSSIRSGEGISLMGRVLDESKANGQILFNFIADEGGEEISVYVDLEGVDFNRGYLFQPGSEGSYELKVYLGGPEDSSLQYLDGFSIQIAAGSGLVSIPANYFRGITLDEPLEIDWPAGRDRWVEGSVGRGIAAVRVELEGEAVAVEREIGVVDGRFRLRLYLDEAARGEVVLRLLQQGEDGRWTNGGEAPLQAVLAPPTGQLQVGALSLSPRVGETETLALTNVGTARLRKIRYEVEGPFSIVGDIGELEPGAQALLHLGYAGSGGESGLLHIYSDDPRRPEQQVALNGLSSADSALPFLTQRAGADGILALDVDLTRSDYLLVLYSAAVAGVDEDAHFAYSVGASLPAARLAKQREIAPVAGESAPLAGESFLRARERRLAEGYRNYVGPSAKRMAIKTEIGDRRRFAYAGFVDGGNPIAVDATAVYVGERAVAWIQDDMRPSVDNLSREQVIAAVEQFSREDFELVSTFFGRASDIDGDGRIAFLFTHWVDDEDGLVGFYDASSVLPEGVGGDGNLSDLIFISPTQSVDFYRSLLVHEFQHLINFNEHVLVRRGEGEESWLNEGLSHLSEDLVAGYSESGHDDNISAYLRDPEVTGLIGDAGGSSAKRGAAYLFVRGLRDRLGAGVIQRLVATGLAGRDNVEEAAGQTMDELLAFWGAQLYASGQGINVHPFFNFNSSLLQSGSGRGLPLPAERRYTVGAQAVRGAVAARGIAYVRVRGGTAERLLIEADPAAQLGVVAMPLRDGFVNRAQMPPDYVPGLHFDSALPAVLIAGGQYRASGRVVDPSIASLLFRFAGADTLRFTIDIIDRQFDEILSVPVAGEYALEVFVGDGEGTLDLAAGFAPVWVETAGDITVVEESAASVPDFYALGRVFPNPFNASVVVPFDLQGANESVSLEIFNVLGQKVRTLLRGPMASGSQRAIWDGRDETGQSLASGLYWFRLRVAQFQQVRSAVLLR